MSEPTYDIQVPSHLGYAGNTRGLRRVLTEIIAAVNDLDTATGMTEEQVQALIDSALAGLEVTAAEVTFTPGESGLSAADVQAALLELNTALGDLSFGGDEVTFAPGDSGLVSENVSAAILELKGIVEALGADDIAFSSENYTAEDVGGALEEIHGRVADWEREAIQRGSVVLSGSNPTPVSFSQPTAAVVDTAAETFDLDPGDDLQITVNGGSKRTIVFRGTAGYTQSGEDPMANLSAEIDTKLKVGVDGAEPVELTFDWSGKTTAPLVAAHMETKVQEEFAAAQVLCAPEKYVLETASANGGTFALKRGGSVITGCSAIAYNEDAGTIQTLLEAEYGAGAVAVSRNGTELTFLFTLAFNQESGTGGLSSDLTSIAYPDGENDATWTQVAHSTFRYLIWSGTFGTASEVVVERGDSLDVYDELGFADKVDVAGTGDADNLALTTAEELAARIEDVLVGTHSEPVTVTVTGDDKVRITTVGKGAAATLEVDNAGTANTALDVSSASDSQGGNGLGFAHDMADDQYTVLCQIVEAGDPGQATLAVGNKATGGFDLYCDTGAATFTVDLVIIGEVGGD